MAKEVTVDDTKRATVEQWTADPCEARNAAGTLGEREYLERLLVARQLYAPWMATELDYAGAAGKRVLDVGCGQGIDLVQFLRHGAEASGVDLTPRHVDLARRHIDVCGLRADVRLADAERLPFDDASFDRVTSNGVLHHTPDMPRALREVRRVIRPGGEARVIVYNRNSLHYWMNQVLLSGILQGGLLRERSMTGVLASVEYSRVGARPLVRVYSRRTLRQMLTEAGLRTPAVEVRHFRPTDAFVYELLARRVRRLNDPGLLDRIGRVAGWYLVARARI